MINLQSEARSQRRGCAKSWESSLSLSSHWTLHCKYGRRIERASVHACEILTRPPRTCTNHASDTDTVELSAQESHGHDAKGIFSGLMHDCESTELHRGVYGQYTIRQ